MGRRRRSASCCSADYTRRGFLDGIGLRLPTICVRPGTPNRAASGFFSSIIREPLIGQEAVLPVPDAVRHWHASPRAAVGFLVHAATLEEHRLGNRRCLTMPGVSVTVAEQIESLRRLAGDEAVGLIHSEPDETLMRIVAGWPATSMPDGQSRLGFRADSDFDEIIRVHVEDELAGVTPRVAGAEGSLSSPVQAAASARQQPWRARRRRLHRDTHGPTTRAARGSRHRRGPRCTRGDV